RGAPVNTTRQDGRKAGRQKSNAGRRNGGNDEGGREGRRRVKAGGTAFEAPFQPFGLAAFVVPAVAPSIREFLPFCRPASLPSCLPALPLCSNQRSDRLADDRLLDVARRPQVEDDD